MPLELRQVYRTADYEPAYDVDNDDFGDIHWDHYPYTVRDSQKYDHYVAFDDGVEVARVELEPNRQLHPVYVGLDVTKPIVDVWYFEVASSHRRQGVGRAVLDLVVEQYPGQTLIAFSHADDFWAGIGWQAHDRTDGADGNSVLFAHHP